MKKASEILLCGDITAQEAMRLGVVDKVVPLDQLKRGSKKG